MNSLELVRRLIRETGIRVRQQQVQAPHPVGPTPADDLTEVDGLTANHRAQFGPPATAQYTHPGQYDAALRWHLNMPPPPDPHAEARRMHEALARRPKP